jgi:hypothetical protein
MRLQLPLRSKYSLNFRFRGGCCGGISPEMICIIAAGAVIISLLHHYICGLRISYAGPGWVCFERKIIKCLPVIIDIVTELRAERPVFDSRHG